MTSIKLYPGDNRASLQRLIKKGVRVHSVVTDPPYGLVSVQRRFGKQGSKPARTEKNDGSFARLSGGFMGKTWDGTGIERDPEFWSLIYDILLPGGYVFAFSGSRTGHWQACAMELAGFIMHPMHGWVFGTGFPKAVRKGLDVMPQWDGWAYGTQAQKPALEPIYLAQKPFSEKTGAANLAKHGVGAVNINQSRVPHGDTLRGGAEKLWSHYRGGEASADRRYTDRGSTNFAAKPGPRGGDPAGRHPANLMHDGSEAVLALFPFSKGQIANASKNPNRRASQSVYGTMRSAGSGEARRDEGSPARFFHEFRYACELCFDTGITYTPMQCIGDSPTLEGCECGGPLHLEIDPIVYQGKAAKADRAGSNHPTVKPIALMRYLIRHITPPGGTVLDPFAGSGTTAEAARREGFDCMIMEAEPEYVGFLRSRFDLPASVPKDVLELIGAPKLKRAPEDLISLL